MSVFLWDLSAFGISELRARSFPPPPHILHSNRADIFMDDVKRKDPGSLLFPQSVRVWWFLSLAEEHLEVQLPFYIYF